MLKKVLSVVLSAAMLLPTFGLNAMAGETTGSQSGIVLTGADADEFGKTSSPEYQPSVNEEGAIGGGAPGWAKFKDVDFGTDTYTKIEIDAQLWNIDGGQNTVFKIGDVNGATIAQFYNNELIQKQGDANSPYETYTLDITEDAKAQLNGIKDIYMEFSNWSTGNIKSVRFYNDEQSSGGEEESVNLDPIINSTNGWNPGTIVTSDKGKLTVAGAFGNVAAYADEAKEYHNKLLHFNLNVNLDNGEWPGFYVRHKAGSGIFWNGPVDCYGVVFKKDKIELQKGQPSGVSAVIKEVPNNGQYIQSNVTADIVFGAVDVENGVRLFLSVNGETVFDYVDTENPYKDPGSIAVYAFQGPVTLQAIDGESGGEPTPTPTPTPTPEPEEKPTESAYPRVEDERPEQVMEYNLDGTVYYVSANGSENGNGTKENPWNSVAKAAAMVPANQNATIFVMAGTYTETKPIILKSGVNLIGEDKETTILKTPDGVPGIRQEYGTGNVVARLTLDGDNFADSAVLFYRSRNSVITDLNIKRYGEALTLREVRDGDFYNIYVSENYGRQADLSGINCKFHDMVFDCYRTEEEGPGWGIDIGTNTYAYNWDLYDLSVQIPFRGSWDVGTGYKPPAFAFETCGGNIRDIDVYNCDFNNGISLVPYINKQEENSIRFHNNIVRIETGEMMAFEVAKQLTNCEIYENLIIGGSHNFANWDGDELNGLKIYRNVFDMVNNYQTHSHQLLQLGSHYENVTFQNNTVVAHEPPAGDNKVIWVENSPNDQFVYQNNILVYDHNGETLPDKNNVLDATEAIVENNLFWKLAEFTQGVGNIVADPLFVGEGNSMEKYALTEGSPAIDAGVELDDFTPADGKTDLGALEYGEEPFKVGPYQEGSKPVNQFNLGQDFDGALHDWREDIDSIVFFDCYTGWKDSLEKLEDESLLDFYAEYDELNVVDSYDIPAKAFTAQFLVKLKDGSYDGLASYTGIDGVSMKYTVDDTNIISTNASGVINAVNTGTTNFHAILMDGEKELGTSSVAITTPEKVYKQKYTYHPLSDDDFWIIGLDGVISADGETVGFLQTPGEGVEYHVSVPETGTYEMYFQFSQGLQPGSAQEFLLDGVKFHEDTGFYSGGWGIDSLKEYFVGEVEITEGNHDIRILNTNGLAMNYGAVTLIPKNNTAPLDTFDLEHALAQFSNLNEADYDTFKWQAFRAAYEEAEEFLASENKTQLDVERAFIKLISYARKMMVNYKYVDAIKVVDQPKLNYQDGENLDLSKLAIEIIYSDDSTEQVSFADFEKYGITVDLADGTTLTAENNGKAVTVTYYKYSAATEALSVVVPGTVDKAALEKAVEEAEAINTDGYTAESVKVLKDAIAAAKAVLADEAAAQEQVDAHLDALKAAIEGLEKKDDSSSSSEPEESKPDESKPDESGTENSSSESTEEGNPTTGDNNDTVLIWFVLLIASGVMAVLVVTQRKQIKQK